MGGEGCHAGFGSVCGGFGGVFGGCDCVVDFWGERRMGEGRREKREWRRERRGGGQGK